MAKALFEYKIANKLTLDQMSEQMAINRMDLSQMMHDKQFSLLTLKRIAEFFQWGPEEVGQMVMFEPQGGKHGTRKNRSRRARSEPSVDSDSEGRASAA